MENDDKVGKDGKRKAKAERKEDQEVVDKYFNEWPLNELSDDE